MIEVRFQGQTGNQITQYSFGRLMAMYRGSDFHCPPIAAFPELTNEAGGIELPPLPGDIIHIKQSSQCQALLRREIYAALVKFNITLEGYFEWAGYYIDKRLLIKSWFKSTQQTPTIAIHVRGGDGKHHSPPASYYIEAHNLIFNSPEYTGLPITIYTDDVNDDVVKKLANMFSAKVQHGNVREDFDAMRSASHLIIGNSTFAWWAAFLSNAKVIQPEPTSGFRSWQMPNTDLRVPEWRQVKYTP